MTMNQAQAAQQANQAASQNPELQLEQAKLELDKQELARKDEDSKRDYEIALQRLQVQREQNAAMARNQQTNTILNKQKADADRTAKIVVEAAKAQSKRNQPPRGNK